MFKICRFAAGISLLATCFVVLANQSGTAGEGYKTPYVIEYKFPVSELLHDIEHGARGSTEGESSVPHGEWYSKRVREKWGSWGPPAHHFAVPAGVGEKSAEWQRERVVAVAMRFQGYKYQHHHVPDWNPPAGWPWQEVKSGHNSKGVDCSNFTAFVYNQGFGLKPTGAIKEQSQQLEIPLPDGRTHHAEKIEKPATYAALVNKLKTGDLLYIRNRSEEISHVVIWVGSIGKSSDGAPLILDSHGDGVKDSRGATIPNGIHLRPFVENSWYYKSASHAHRIIREK